MSTTTVLPVSQPKPDLLCEVTNRALGGPEGDIISVILSEVIEAMYDTFRPSEEDINTAIEEEKDSDVLLRIQEFADDFRRNARPDEERSTEDKFSALMYSIIQNKRHHIHEPKVPEGLDARSYTIGYEVCMWELTEPCDRGLDPRAQLS